MNGTHAAIAERAGRRKTTDWTSFTPSWTNVTVGNATNDGQYRYVAGDLHVRIHFVFGSTTSFSGNVSVTLPDSQTSANDGVRSTGSLNAKDGSTDQSGHCGVPANSTSIQCFAGNNSLAGNDINATYPFTWVTGDQIQLQIHVAL